MFPVFTCIYLVILVDPLFLDTPYTSLYVFVPFQVNLMTVVRWDHDYFKGGAIEAIN